ncbi:ACT domain-containing protein [Ferruginibacter sp.]
MTLQQVIQQSWFSVYSETYIYTRVKEVLHPEKHLLVMRDHIEVTVVTAEENLPLLGAYEANKDKWKLVNIRCGNPFYCVGFIASITNSLAQNGIDIVLASSFSNDLVLVMENDLERSIAVLLSIGFTQRTNDLF